MNWEYLVKTVYYDSLIEVELNNLGKDGWELISSIKKDDYSFLIIFKRPYRYIQNTGVR